MLVHRSQYHFGGFVATMCFVLVATFVICGSIPAIADDAPTLAPYRHGGSVAAFFPDVTYDPAIPSPETVLGFELGSRPVRYEEMVRYLRTLDEASPRAELHEFGHTHEARKLYYLIVGSEQNVANAEKIRTDIGTIANPPASGTVSGADRIIAETPVIAWMAYSIHGDELSGVDAALMTAYRLVAGTDGTAQKIRDNVLVLIDPNQNPDGRERYLSQIFSLSGVAPSTDGQSLQHDGSWPYGRTNHYLFDMNRDWMPLVHPESQGRVRTILRWNPQLVVDAHEMGAQSSYLFSPPREPINLNVTKVQRRWWDVFAADQGAAFDQRRWSYYTGDWHEEWYPGYGSSWSLFTGAVGILYEQAGVSGSGVKRYDGTTLSYAESVAKQTVSSLANLRTAASNRSALLRDFARVRSDAVIGKEKRLRGAFILSPGKNPGRESLFLNKMLLQGFRVERATESFAATVETPGGTKKNRAFPVGACLIPLNQPLGSLARAILEFDPHLTPEFLQEERRELEKGNGTRLYEISGWSMALAYDLDITYAAGRPRPAIEILTAALEAVPGGFVRRSAGYGFLLPIDDDRSTKALVQILERGLSVRGSEKPFTHDGTSYARGTLLLRRAENPEDLEAQLATIADATGAAIVGASSGYSSDGPDLGSDLFHLLPTPRVGLFIGSGTDYTSCGPLWHLLDNELGMRQSLLDVQQLANYNLDAYNVLILPSYWGGASGLRSDIGENGLKKLRTWISSGGTLIAIGNAAFMCADSASGLSGARERGAVLAKLADYERAYNEERAAFTATVDTNAVWKGIHKKNSKSPAKLIARDLDRLKRVNEKGRLFSPRGVIFKLDLNTEHWLSIGVNSHTNAIIYTSDALMAKSPVEAPARLAQGTSMRLAGLLWPEGRERWEKTAFMTREGMERGQIILFAADPYFRGYFHGTKRLFLNAVLLGPGFGTRTTAPW